MTGEGAFWIILAFLFIVLIGGLLVAHVRNKNRKEDVANAMKFDNVQPFLTNFDSAVGMRQRGNFYYVWTQNGRIWRINKLNGERILVLDKVSDTEKVFGGVYNFGSDERGLLGVAFNPIDVKNEVFVGYSAPKTDPNDKSTNHIARLSKFTIQDKDGPNERFVQESVVLDIPEQESYHHAQSVEFGADGLLYYSVGDGGPQGDPYGHAQDLNDLRGKMLRIDVNNNGVGAKTYSIPPTNPFSDGKQGRAEIIALGLRNPWRFSMESGNRIFIADVGNNSQESIKILQLPTDQNEMLKPVNFGWAVYEGDEKTGNKKNGSLQKLSVEPWTQPAFTYKTGGDLGRATVGGYLLPKMNASDKDRFVFGDFVSGKLVVIENQGEGKSWKMISAFSPDEWFPKDKLGSSSHNPTQQNVSDAFKNGKKNISSLARDDAGNIYVIVWAQGADENERSSIYTLVQK